MNQLSVTSTSLSDRAFLDSLLHRHRSVLSELEFIRLAGSSFHRVLDTRQPRRSYRPATEILRRYYDEWENFPIFRTES